jgi:magnesium transporter
MRYITDADVKEIVTDLRLLIKRQNQGALRNILIDLHPADIALLLGRLRKNERKYIFQLLPDQHASAVLTELETPLSDQILEDLPEKKISALVDQMSSDDAADIISDLPEDVADRVLDHVTEEVSEDVKELLAYEEDTAGGIMALEFVAVNAKSTVKETIRAIRKAKKYMDYIHTVWVIDDSNVLLGSISLASLVLAKGKTPVSEIMDKSVRYVYTDKDQEEVAFIFRKYDLVTLPVVNAQQQLVGQITIDDIVDVFEEEASEDITILAGANDEELREESFIKISWFRLPWLFIAFCGQIISAFIINRHLEPMQQGNLIPLLAFIPIIMAMGGSSGLQSSTIVIRGLATGEISIHSIRRRFFRELRVSLFLGLIFGLTMMGIVGIWKNNLTMGIIIGLALNIVILESTIFGGLIPFFLKRFNFDPALASGPFITTFNDIIGLAIYLTIIVYSIPGMIGT